MQALINHADVLVVGAGLAGLSCAVSLLSVVGRVTVVEAASLSGGRAASWTDSVTGDVVDLGPHIVLTEYRNMFRFLDMLGTRESIVWQKGKLITLLEGGEQTVMRVHKLPPPLHLLPSLLATRSISIKDKLSNLPAVRLAMKLTEADVIRLDGMTAHELLTSMGVSRRFIDWFWKSASMAVMNVPLERCSAGALFRVYAQIMGHNDYRIGFAGTGLADMFIPAAARLITESNGSLRECCRISQLLMDGDRCVGAVTSSGEQIRARYTVLAVPPQAAAALMPERLVGKWKNFELSPYVSVYLWFDRKLTHEQFWTRVWKPEDLNSDFYDLSNIRSGRQQRPSVIASNIIYSHRAADLDDAQIIARTVEEIAEFVPDAARANLLHAAVHRIPMAIPCPLPGTEKARPATLTSIPGLLLAGDWIQTGLPASMESAVCAGFMAAEEISQAEGQQLHLALAPRKPTGLSGLYRRLAS